MKYTQEQLRVGAEKAFILDMIVNRFPSGIVSYVADSFDLWSVITKILPTVKSQIMARDGKLVIRPDSGDPVKIICGLDYEEVESKADYDGNSPFLKFKDEFYTPVWHSYNNDDGEWEFNKLKTQPSVSEQKGVVELLWDIFGGTINEQGYKVLDSHIGVIYGDSITLERQVEIYRQLAAKGFAATNVVLGVGSFTYQYNTRDTLGLAAKGAWFEITDEDGKRTGYPIYKDPVTDDGTKKSLKGFQLVLKDENGEYYVKSDVTEQEAEGGELRVIYWDGLFKNVTTFSEIRELAKM